MESGARSSSPDPSEAGATEAHSLYGDPLRALSTLAGSGLASVRHTPPLLPL